MSHIKRIILFARDLAPELLIAYDIARINDCERNGGHHWGPAVYNADTQTLTAVCSRCEFSHSVPCAITGTDSTRTMTIDSSN